MKTIIELEFEAFIERATTQSGILDHSIFITGSYPNAPGGEMTSSFGTVPPWIQAYFETPGYIYTYTSKTPSYMPAEDPTEVADKLEQLKGLATPSLRVFEVKGYRNWTEGPWSGFPKEIKLKN